MVPRVRVRGKSRYSSRSGLCCRPHKHVRCSDGRSRRTDSGNVAEEQDSSAEDPPCAKSCRSRRAQIGRCSNGGADPTVQGWRCRFRRRAGVVQQRRRRSDDADFDGRARRSDGRRAQIGGGRGAGRTELTTRLAADGAAGGGRSRGRGALNRWRGWRRTEQGRADRRRSGWRMVQGAAAGGKPRRRSRRGGKPRRRLRRGRDGGRGEEENRDGS
jgi:hypothetical protein